MKKGQAFIIVAIVISTSLLIIKMSSQRPRIVEEKRQLELTFENSLYSNVVEEFKNVIRYSFYYPLNITANVQDFGNFSELKMGEHSLEFQMFFVGAIANKTTNYLNISVVNLLGSSAAVNLTLNNAQSNATSLANYNRWDVNFSITAGNSYVLTIRYDSEIENVTIKTKSGKDVFTEYFDIRLISENAYHRNKFTETLNLR